MKRREVLFAVIGGVVGAVLTMTVCTFLPLGAQGQSDTKFGKITCTELEVVSNGRSRVAIGASEDGGYVIVANRAGMPVAAMQVTEDGGIVNVRGRGKRSISGVRMHVYEHGAGVHVYDQNGRERAGITSTESGGTLGVMDENENPLVIISSKRLFVMNQDTLDSGMVNVFGPDYSDGVRLSVNKNGGRVSVFGKGGNGSRAIMGVNEYGNGAVNTWDKNGYRLETLK